MLIVEASLIWENTFVFVEGMDTIEFVNVETHQMSLPFSSEKPIFFNCVDCKAYGMIYSETTVEGAGASPPDALPMCWRTPPKPYQNQ